MNAKKLFMEYGIFAIILVGAMLVLPPALTPILGPTLGQFTSYFITGGIGVLSLWVSKQTRKAIE